MSNPTELILPLKKQWYNMIKSEEKPEEYREITPYWIVRLVDGTFLPKDWWKYEDEESIERLWNAIYFPKEYSKVKFTLGYPKREDTSRRMTFNNPKIRIGTGRPEWGAVEGKKYFVITWDK